MMVSEVTAENWSECEDYLGSLEDLTFVDTWTWRRVIEKAYGLPQYWFSARRDGRICGFLALVLSTNPFFGRYLVTAAFGNQGGFYAEDDHAERALLAKALEVQERADASYTLVRLLDGDTPPPPGWDQDPSYATYYLTLDSDPDWYYKHRLRSIVRNRIKKARGHDLVVRFGHGELADDFWRVINRAARDLGSPYHPRAYLDTLVTEHGENALLALLYTRDGRPIGGSLLVYREKAASQLHVVCLRPYWSLYANDYLYWAVIEECCRRGVTRLDLGRSLVGSGNERFKMKWGPERRAIANWYHRSDGGALPHLSPGNPKFALARATWRRMPMPLAKLIGPRVMSGLL